MTDSANAEGTANSPGGDVTQPPPPPPVPEQPVLTIGDIVVSAHWVVTPTGNTPLAGSMWMVSDQSQRVKKHPWWTILLAILLFPIGLLFLLVTNEEIDGYMEVKVRGTGLAYTSQVPIVGPYAAQTIRQQVAQAESMAAALDSS
jgi:hypothetical protein